MAVKHKTKVEYLGNTLDHKFLWKIHVSNLYGKTTKVLRMFIASKNLGRTLEIACFVGINSSDVISERSVRQPFWDGGFNCITIEFSFLPSDRSDSFVGK